MACHLLVTGAPRAWAASDTLAPTVTGFTVSPTTIDTSLGPQTIEASIQVMDDLSGFTMVGWPHASTASAVATFRSPAGGIARVAFSPHQRVSGDHLDGVYAGQTTLPRYSHAGTWSLQDLVVTDIVGNRRVLGLGQVEALGSSTRFTVTGLEDRTPPELVSLSIGPAEVDSESERQFFPMTVHLKDTISGLDPDPAFPVSTYASATFVGPSRRQNAYAMFLKSNRVTGDKFDGVYTNFVALPPYAESGTWVLNGLAIVDAAGNQRTISTAEIINLGLPYQFTVENPVGGPGDSTPPQLAGLALSPARIPSTESGSSIAITAHLSDDLSGFYVPSSGYTGPTRASASFASPSKVQTAHVSFGFGDLNQVSGTPTDFTCTSYLALPRYSETGVWTVTSLNLTDVAGNSRFYLGVDLRQLGFPAAFAVGVAPSLKIDRQAEQLLVSWPTWATDFSLWGSGLVGPGSHWVPIGTDPVVLGETAIVAVPVSVGNRFFRLEAPP
jgi:hypothetical protein